MAVAVLQFHGQVDGGEIIGGGHHRDDRHEHLDLDEGVQRVGDHGDESGVLLGLDACCAQDLLSILAHPRGVGLGA